MNRQSPGINKDEKRGQSQTQSTSERKKRLCLEADIKPKSVGVACKQDMMAEDRDTARPGMEERERPLILKLGLELGQVTGAASVGFC